MTSQPNYDHAVYWCKEREAIRVRLAAYHAAAQLETGFARENPSPSFTTDPILREWRFCNVRREDDRVTWWIRKNVREPYADHPLLWLMLCLARQINLPSTLEDLIVRYPGAWPGDPLFDPAHLRDALEDRASMDLKNYTGVYVISAPAKGGKGSKPRYTAETIIGKLFEHRERLAPLFTGSRAESMRLAHAKLMTYDGWGPFLAYQAVVDMRFTKIFDHAVDRTTWCAAGPGTLRGLNRVYGRPVDQGLDKMKSPGVQDRARRELVEMWPILVKRSGVNMDLSDVPNVMCEVDKYLRVKNGEGTPRNRYIPNLAPWGSAADHPF